MCSTTTTTTTSLTMINNHSSTESSLPVVHFNFCPHCGVDVSQFSHEASCPKSL
ncbi:hypothetical protein BDA99DRAFT_501834 [Phascolomyces articulosus]|uniref:Uncharacterized protein n=1 Tax=Phascolomyces articulosus TaxID=60185 RepID=A0AAD5KGA8_9FUNG|nr:hypothetical protein BDA99DRAFT_501834 [Phascolomyces articulosus]